jgi:formylglycine-generating enzyme required for sulfatase activity
MRFSTMLLGSVMVLFGCGGTAATASEPMAPVADEPATEHGAPDTEATVRTNSTRIASHQIDAERFTWRSIDHKSWQIASGTFEAPEVTDAREGGVDGCPAGMVHVKGDMKVDDGRMEQMQLDACSDWIDREYPERCQSFDRDAWLEASAALATKSMDYCMDRFEYPNIAGQYPIVSASWDEAAAMCADQGKRLCDEEEWTFACEGEEAQPYGYGAGYERDADACVTDSAWRAWDERKLSPRDGAVAAHEMDRLWQGKAAGAQTQCKSPFGVHDMIGNVDEWTSSTSSEGHRSVLKGGYWGPVRARCRPATRSHDENHHFYQQGFRCCGAAG